MIGHEHLLTVVDKYVAYQSQTLSKYVSKYTILTYSGMALRGNDNIYDDNIYLLRITDGVI